jgi:hypothetical protein
MSAAVTYGRVPTGRSKFEKLSVEAIEAVQQAEQAWVEGDRLGAKRHLVAALRAQLQLTALVNKGSG